MLPSTVPWDYDDTMTDAIAFDTHRFVKNLTASGFTEAQAEALADEQVHLLNSNLATRADISAVESNLHDEIRTVERNLQVEIQAVEKNLQVEIQVFRADFPAVESNLQGEIQTVRTDLSTVERNLQVEIQTFRADLLKWMVTAMIAQTGLVVALVRLL